MRWSRFWTGFGANSGEKVQVVPGKPRGADHGLLERIDDAAARFLRSPRLVSLEESQSRARPGDTTLHALIIVAALLSLAPEAPTPKKAWHRSSIDAENKHVHDARASTMVRQTAVVHANQASG